VSELEQQGQQLEPERELVPKPEIPLALMFEQMLLLGLERQLV